MTLFSWIGQYASLFIKTVLFFCLLSPYFLVAYFMDRLKARRILRKDWNLKFLARHKDEIDCLRDHKLNGVEIKRINKGATNLIYRLIVGTEAGQRIPMVAKRFLSSGSGICFLGSVLGPFPKGMPLRLKTRYRQEAALLSEIKLSGMDVPRVLFSDNQERLILTEYIKGDDLGDVLELIASERELGQDYLDIFSECGRSLGMLHKAGYCMVSHNDRSRILTEDGRIYFVDMELATQKNVRWWDIAIFIHWMRIKLGFTDSGKIERLEKALLSGYEQTDAVDKISIDRHLHNLRIYTLFAKLAMRINRRLKKRPIGRARGR